MENNNQLPIGTVLDSGMRKYRIEAVLGQGGFGITYKATGRVRVGNIEATISFAIKEHFVKQYNERRGTTVVTPTSSNATEVNDSIEAFLSEATRLNRLSLEHPGIVKVNENFRANDTAYYVMEYIEGESLRHHVEHHAGGRLPETEAVSIIRLAGKSVQYLHDNRVNHLDIKPDNILLRNDGQPVLIDLGLAKHYDRKGRATSTLKVAGTSDGYSPLEQYAGLDCFSPQADVYALAATLLFMLTGKDPKKASDIRPADIKASLESAASAATVSAVVRAMSMLQENRTGSVNDLLAELEGNAEIKRKEVKSGHSTVVINPPKLRLKPKSLPWKRISAYSAGVVGSALFVWGVITVVRNNKADDAIPQKQQAIELVDSTTLSTDAAGTALYVKDMNYSVPTMGEGKYTGAVDEQGLPHDSVGFFKSEKNDIEYRGSFVHGIAEGKSSYRVKNQTFEGTFKNNEYDSGTLTIEDGSFFVGSFFKSGEPYNGEWYDKSGKKDANVKDGKEVKVK